MGFGNNDPEWYLIFNDGTRTEPRTHTHLSEFSEYTYDPKYHILKRIRIQYHKQISVLRGIEFYDDEDNLVVRVGRIFDL